MSLVIQNLKTQVNGVQILYGVNLEVKPGELHVIMGPNGSGKSTLAYTLAGHPDYLVSNPKPQKSNSKQSSKILLDGQDLLNLSPDERARLGLFLAFQYPVEVPGVKVQNFLWEAHKGKGQRAKGKDFSSVLEFRRYLRGLAEDLGVGENFLSRGLNEGFSGGEKKRLEVLQMAVMEPKYAILDETDSGLDIDAIKAVAKGVKKIVKNFETGVILITHYQRILKFLSPDFVHVMVDGEIVESGGKELAKKLEKKGYEDFR